MAAATLAPETEAAWEDYVQSATQRMQERTLPGHSFLWVDESPERLAKVRAGEVLVGPAGPNNPKKVHSGLIHDWIGAVFIEHASLDDVTGILRDYARYKDYYRPAVIDSRMISLTDTDDRFSMLLRNKSLLLKTAFDAEYDACYFRAGPHRMYSISRSTRVQEIQDYGTSSEHFLPLGAGSGIIWHLFAITRFMERDGGVYVEVEAIVLSRDIPLALRWFVDPIVRKVSRSSLTTSLEQTAKAVSERGELARVAQVSH